jgi:hypothetical protein
MWPAQCTKPLSSGAGLGTSRSKVLDGEVIFLFSYLQVPTDRTLANEGWATCLKLSQITCGKQVSSSSLLCTRQGLRVNVCPPRGGCFFALSLLLLSPSSPLQ